MIVGNLKEWKSLNGLEGLGAAFRFLEDSGTHSLPAGKHAIDGERVYALVIKGATRSPDSGEFESHRKYIDVQYLVAGKEMIGVSPLDQLAASQPYQEDIDATLYAVPKSYSHLEMQPGRFAVFFPEDGHLPNCHLHGEHELHKVVVKVSVELHQQE